MAKNKLFHTAAEGMAFRSKERCYPTGCRLLNTAFGMFDPITGLPGIPQATVLEAFGPNASLKTALWESLAGNIHKINPEARVLAILSEEPDYQRFLEAGMDMDRVDCWTYYNPNNAGLISSIEEGLDLVNECVSDPKSNYELVVIDSLKGMTPSGDLFDKKGEVREMNDKGALVARASLSNNFFGRFAACNKSRAILFGTNQVSDQIGPSYLTGGNFKTQTACGRGKEHWAKLRIECNSTLPDATDKVEKGFFENKVYNVIKPVYYLQKNKYGYPFRKVISEFSLTEKRFLNEVNCLSAAEYLNLIERRGTSIWVIEGQSCRSKAEAQRFLHENQDVQDRLWRQIDSRHVELFGTPKAKSSKEALDD